MSQEPCDHKGYDVDFKPEGLRAYCRDCDHVGRLVFTPGTETVRDGVHYQSGRIEWSAKDDKS